MYLESQTSHYAIHKDQLLVSVSKRLSRKGRMGGGGGGGNSVSYSGTYKTAKWSNESKYSKLTKLKKYMQSGQLRYVVKYKVKKND